MSVCKTNIDDFTRTVGLDVSAELSIQRVEMRLDRRVEMRQLRQISQKMDKLRSPG